MGCGASASKKGPAAVLKGTCRILAGARIASAAMDKPASEVGKLKDARTWPCALASPGIQAEAEIP